MARFKIAKRIEGSCSAWFIPDLPHGAVFTAQSPKDEGADTKLTSSTKLIQHRHAIKKPDDVTRVRVFVDVLEVRIEGVIVEVEIGIDIARKLPYVGDVGMLLGIEDVWRTNLGVARLGIGDRHFAVVIIVVHSSDDFVDGNGLENAVEIADEPV